MMVNAAVMPANSETSERHLSRSIKVFEKKGIFKIKRVCRQGSELISFINAEGRIAFAKLVALDEKAVKSLV